jgi:hypothetical protein
MLTNFILRSATMHLAAMALLALLAAGCSSSDKTDQQAQAKTGSLSQPAAKTPVDAPAAPQVKPLVPPPSLMPIDERPRETAEPARYPADDPTADPPAFVPPAQRVSEARNRTARAADLLAPGDSEESNAAQPARLGLDAPGGAQANPLREGRLPPAGSDTRFPAEPRQLAVEPREAPSPPRTIASEPKGVQPEPRALQPEPKNVATPAKTKRPDPPSHGKHSKEKFDPIKVNGPIFEGWGKPKLALVITGRQDGYLEPCGCAGLDRMKGGMARRHTLLKQLRAAKWPVAVLDVGGIANKRFSHQAVLKFQTTLEAMWTMGYDVVMLGPNDLKLPSGEVLAATLGVGDKPSLFVSANVVLVETPPMRVIEVGGKRLAITGVLGKKYQKEINNPDVVMSDPVASLKKIVPEMKKTKADGLILLAYADMAETLALGKAFPEFDVIVTAGGAPEAPTRLDGLRKIEGSKAKLIEVGEKGMDVIVLGLFDDPKQPVRYQRVPLDSRFASSPDMKARMAAYQDQIKMLGLERLGVKAQPHPLQQTHGAFVGSEKCESCHAESYRIWKKTPHAKALQSLIKADPPRYFDPECVACHVVGWNPREYHPYQSGYVSQEKTPKLVNVGCEDCHGPGEKHIAAENGNDKALKERLQQEVRITKDEASNPLSPKQNCFNCHDGDNSPDFEFKTYWPQVEHYEKE